MRDPWDEEHAVPEAAWPYPDSPNQYGFEGTIARFDAFASSARRIGGVRGVLVKIVVCVVLVGLLSGIVAVGAGAVRLLG